LCKFGSILLSINSGEDAAKCEANSNGAEFRLRFVFPKAKKIYGGEGLVESRGDVAGSVDT
jgi:hypothetical protein